MLVIDDVHLAGPELAAGIVGVLAASAPPALRLVLSGRGHPSIQLERLRYGEGLGEIGAAELPLPGTKSPGSPLRWDRTPDFDAGSLWHADRRMAGRRPREPHAPWRRAATCRAGCAKTSRPDLPLADYIAEEVLDQLDPPLADFVLRATTCDWLGRRLAVELHGRPDGGMLLEACLRDGLFIDEHEYRGGESMYRWHSLFAAQCRRILERRDPLLAERLHRVAARLLPGHRRE